MALTSPLGQLFQKLITKIEAEVPGIRFIDQDWDQLGDEQPPVSYPCVLIDFPETGFTQMQGYQLGIATIRLKLVYRSYTSTSNITPDVNREAALQFYELEQQLYEALQAWYADSLLCNAMIRKSAVTEKRDDGLRVRVLEFEGAYNDASVTG